MGHLQQAMILAGAGAPTQASFNTHILTRGSNTTVSGGTALNSIGVSASSIGTTVLTYTKGSGTMFGSCWGMSATEDSGLEGFVVHAFPDLPTYTALVNGDKFLMVINRASYSDSLSVSRNGYVSGSYGSLYDSLRCTEFTFWDRLLSKARTVNPRATGSYSDYLF